MARLQTPTPTNNPDTPNQGDQKNCAGLSLILRPEFVSNHFLYLFGGLLAAEFTAKGNALQDSLGNIESHVVFAPRRPTLAFCDDLCGVFPIPSPPESSRSPSACI